jgi:6-phosphogluconate dehydrogenase
LIEITSQIFRKIDPETGKPLVDVILDKAGQKGTGIWTLQAAIKQYVVISTINAAVEARVISSRKEERVAASEILPQPRARTFKGNRDRFVDAVRDALYASKIISYAQGMELLRSGSTAYEWNLNLSDIATIWRGGCIIRAKFLNRIVEAYKRNPALQNLLPRPIFHPGHQKSAAEMAARCLDCYQIRHTGPRVFRLVGVLRQLSLFSPSSESPASATRFLWCAHLRAH